MKILKKALQRNFNIDESYYTIAELEELKNSGLFFKIENSADYRIYASDCKEVKIICKDGFYCPVVVLHSGKIIHIKL